MANGLLACHTHPIKGEVQLPVGVGLGTGKTCKVEDWLLLFRNAGQTRLLVDSTLRVCEPTANRKRRLASDSRQSGESLEQPSDHYWSEVRHSCRSQELAGFSNSRSLAECSLMTDNRLVSMLHTGY